MKNGYDLVWVEGNAGILVCPVREIWQFKVFVGKEVTKFYWKLYFDLCKTEWTEKQRVRNYEQETGALVWLAEEDHVSDIMDTLETE